MNIPIGEEDLYLISKKGLGDYKPSDLEYIDSKKKLMLRKEAKLFFDTLLTDARTYGYLIYIVSAFREYKHQNYLYNSIEQKLSRKKGCAGNLPPGHSEHQLGTVCDLTCKSVEYNLTQYFAKTPEFQWLLKHSPKYGIYLSYTSFNHKKRDLIYEPWHFRYWGKKYINNIPKNILYHEYYETIRNAINYLNSTDTCLF